MIKPHFLYIYWNLAYKHRQRYYSSKYAQQQSYLFCG